jgi:hypothetical protein
VFDQYLTCFAPAPMGYADEFAPGICFQSLFDHYLTNFDLGFDICSVLAA